MIIAIAGLVLLLICSGFFSGSETALTAASRARIQALIGNNDKRAERVAKLHSRMEKVIGTVLLGNTLVNALTAVLMSEVLGHFFGETGATPVLAAVVATAFLYIFSE